MLRLPPDSDSLRLHLESTNYLTYLQKIFNLKTHPSPIDHEWHLVGGLCLPIRSTQPPLPSSISLLTDLQTVENNENDNDLEIDDCESDDYDSESDDSCSD